MKEEIEMSNYHLRQQFSKTNTTEGRGEMPPSCINVSVDAEVREHSPIHLPERSSFSLLADKISHWQGIDT